MTYATYDRLAALLDEQERALQTGAMDKLDALAAQIEQAVAAVTTLDLEPTRLSREQASALARRIQSLQQRVHRNQELWFQVLDRTRRAAEQLQASRRYAASLAGQPTAGRRYSRSG